MRFKLALMAVILSFASMANARIVGCDFDSTKTFEQLTNKYTVKLSLNSDVVIDRNNDYKSGENYELWMKDKTQNERLAFDGSEIKISSLSLLGDEQIPDTLIIQFIASSKVDTLAFYSRDDESVLVKLKNTSFLILKCSEK